MSAVTGSTSAAQGAPSRQNCGDRDENDDPELVRSSTRGMRGQYCHCGCGYIALGVSGGSSCRRRSDGYQQQVDLDTPVIRYIPDLRLSDPRAAQAITLRQLLSHTSGLPPDKQWPPQVPPTREGMVGEFANMPITAQPGHCFSTVADARTRSLRP